MSGTDVAGYGARFSPCRTWRYTLTRALAGDGCGTVVFIGLNPSTADEAKDDPTIRRCIRFARDWGFARMMMLNIYAFRATDPKVMFAAADPVGPDNDRLISEVVRNAHLVVCAWGSTGSTQIRAKEVLHLIEAPHALGLTQNGSPRHPLYLRADTHPVPFAHCPAEAAWTG